MRNRAYAAAVAPVAHAVAHPAVVAHPIAHAVAHPAVVAREFVRDCFARIPHL